MRLTFLGTAASEGYPNAFCACENCRRAREAGGPSLRKRCSALVEDDLLIDLGPDLMAAAQQHQISLANIQYCLQTHEHGDHLDPHHFVSRSRHCGVYDTPCLNYYATRGALGHVARAFDGQLSPAGLLDPDAGERLNLRVHTVEPYQSYAIGPYRVFTVPAAHAPSLQALLYAIDLRGRSLFYGTDTGPLPGDLWESLALRGWRFNAVVLDHTFGVNDHSTGHLNADQVVEHVAAMRTHGLLADDARIFAHHIAHHSNPVHHELVELAARRGYEVAHDGLTVEV